MKKIKLIMLVVFVILISYVMCSKKVTTKNHVNTNPFGGPDYSNVKSNPMKVITYN